MQARAHPDLLQIGLIVRWNADVVVLVVVQELIGEHKIAVLYNTCLYLFFGEKFI